MEKQTISITAKQHGDTIYIVEHAISNTAKETAYEKVKRLLLNEPTKPEKQAS